MRRVLTAALIAALVLTVAMPAVAGAHTTSTPKGKPTFVSHPFVKRCALKVDKPFKVWGFVKTYKRRPLTAESTVTIEVQKWMGGRSWETSAGLATTATISATGKFKKKTNYATTMEVGATGRYRLAARLVWKDAQGIEHAKRSSWKYIRIK